MDLGYKGALEGHGSSGRLECSLWQEELVSLCSTPGPLRTSTPTCLSEEDSQELTKNAFLLRRVSEMLENRTLGRNAGG